MQYSNETIINLPRKRVIELFDNTENMYRWMPTLLRHEHLSGEPGKEGAQMKLIFKNGKREMEMIETVTKRNLPQEFHGTYDAKGVHNIQKNYFEEVDAQHTRWRSDSIFEFSSFGMKLFGWLMPGLFKKQSKKFMINFKEFAEGKRSEKE